MNNASTRRRWCALSSAALGGLLQAPLHAEQTRYRARVQMFAVPSDFWMDKVEGQNLAAPALQALLDATAQAPQGPVQRLLDQQLDLKEGTPVEYRNGVDADYVTGWQQDSTGLKMVPGSLVKRFSGTLLELELKEVNGGVGEPVVHIQVEHHLSPPSSFLVNYANAATGAERARLSVELPRLEYLSWMGDVLLRQDWRLVAAVLRPSNGTPAAESTQLRYVILLKGTPIS